MHILPDLSCYNVIQYELRLTIILHGEMSYGQMLLTAINRHLTSQQAPQHPSIDNVQISNPMRMRAIATPFNMSLRLITDDELTVLAA